MIIQLQIDKPRIRFNLLKTLRDERITLLLSGVAIIIATLWVYS